MGNNKTSNLDFTDTKNVDYADMPQSNDVTLYKDQWAVTLAGTTSEVVYTPSWNTWHGYYVEVEELQNIIDKFSQWVVGKGYKADAATTEMLDKIRGNGKETFNHIMFNAVRTKKIGGDFFAEIIKDKRGKLRNLKPLDPASITIYANNAGMIEKYVQQIFVDDGKNGKEKREITFDPDDILHLMNNKIANQIHGNSTIQKLKNVIAMRQEAMKDLRVVFHRYVKPLLITSVDTDNATEIAAYKSKLDQAMSKGENLVVPKGTVDNIERVSIPQFSSLDPLPWIKELNRYFILAEGVPELILGDATGSTEAGSKMLYLAFQQTIEWEQLTLTKDLKAQLGIDIKFEFPQSIAPDLVKDQQKDAGGTKAETNTAGKQE